MLRQENDKPAIWLLLCKEKNRVLAVYVLGDMSKALAVSDYKLTRAVPKNLKPSLPIVEDLERELHQEN